MRKVQLVKIGDKYAIKFRYYFFFSDYYDFKNKNCRWTRCDIYFDYCLTTQEKAEEVFSIFESEKIIK